VFAGAIAPAPPTVGLRNTAAIIGLMLGPRVGAPNPAAADTGILTTAAPAVNESPLPAIFGRGRGKWRPEDLFALDITVSAAGDAPLVGGANAGPDVYVVIGSIINGDIYFTFHNRGASGSGVLFIKMRYDHSLVR
jgi:hypothetical protein